MTVAYVYKWTNKITGKWYIGSRTAKNCHPDDGYICSSRKLKPIILESKDEWLREILCIGEPDDMLTLEAKYLSVLDAKNDPLSYNMHNGDGKFTTAGKEAWNKGIKHPHGKTPWNKGKSKTTDASVAKMAATRATQPAHNKGKTMSDAQRALVTEQHRNRSPETRKRMSEARLGKTQSAESNEKRSETLRGRKQTPEQIAKKAAARRAFYQRKREAEASLLNHPV